MNYKQRALPSIDIPVSLTSLPGTSLQRLPTQVLDIHTAVSVGDTRYLLYTRRGIPLIKTPSQRNRGVQQTVRREVGLGANDLSTSQL